jgi:hypothetical protein
MQAAAEGRAAALPVLLFASLKVALTLAVIGTMAATNSMHAEILHAKSADRRNAVLFHVVVFRVITKGIS